MVNDVRNTSTLDNEDDGYNRLMQSMNGQQPERIEIIPDNALLYLGNGDIQFQRILITPVGLVVPSDATDNELIAIGLILENLDTAVQWNQADWFNRAENRVWGQMYQPGDQTDLKYETLKDYAWIARNVELSIRNRQLSFAHHRLVAPFAEIPELQQNWLQYAATRQPKRLTIEQMKREMQALEETLIPDCIEILRQALATPDLILSRLPRFKVSRQSRPEYIKNWKASRSVIDKALNGELAMTREQFEQALQDYINKARIMWAFQTRQE